MTLINNKLLLLVFNSNYNCLQIFVTKTVTVENPINTLSAAKIDDYTLP